MHYFTFAFLNTKKGAYSKSKSNGFPDC
jgi:hypothetical protein